jgi:rhodanese-related sulfurtransferase
MSIGMKNVFRNTSFLVAAVFSLLISNTAFADTPDSLKGATVVDAVKAKSLIDSGVMVIDSRVANEYAESHIKGAISVPYKEKSAKAVDFDASQDSFDLSKLPADKNTAMVIYCNGAECWKSYKASTAAIKAGYKTVYWLRLGIPEWKAKGYPTE